MRNSSGFFYGPEKIGRAHFTRHFYDKNNMPIIQSAGNILNYSVNYFIKLLSPLGKNRLMAVIVLLIMNHFKKYNKQSGGSLNYLSMVEKILLPMGKNMLVVIASLLLLDYFVKNKKLVGGNQSGSFANRLSIILNNKYYKKQNGGNLLAELGKIAIPVGVNQFNATALLIVLDNLFKKSKIQSGGCQLLHIIKQLVAPLGINQLLTSLGLIILTQTDNKYKKHLQKGGDCGCGGFKKIPYIQTGGNIYGSNNCNCGNTNTLEVVGDIPLNYNNNSQYGCTIPEWGSNLIVEGQGKCL